MQEETPDRISLCYNRIQIYVPRTREDINRARKLLTMLEEELEEETVGTTRQHIEISPGTLAQSIFSPAMSGDQGDLGDSGKTNKPEETPLNPKIDASVNFFIQKFEWDRTKEKAYRTILFFEHEDGARVMIFYLNSRIFTTKEAVLTIPHPTPYSYAPLREIQNNKRTALKFYREYLAKETHSQEIDSAIRNDEEDKEDKDAKEAEEKRLEKLKKTAEVNKDRWKDRVETEMSPRTKELREKFGFRGIEIHDKS